MKADYYFDVISPYVYLQLETFDALPGQLEINYKPVLFAGLLNHWGHLGPAEIPAKRLFTYRFVRWRAIRDGIPMKLPPAHPFNPLRLLRLAALVGNRHEAIREIARFVWRDGFNVDDDASFLELANRLGVQDALVQVSNDEVKEAVKRNTCDATSAGVFGVPTFVFDGQVYWGYDSTQMLIDRIEHPDQFPGELPELPVGASRRR